MIFCAAKVDNDPGAKKMSKLGTEAQLLARLIAQRAKNADSSDRQPTALESRSSIPDSSDLDGSEDAADEQPLRVRAAAKKRKVYEETETPPPLVTAIPISQVVTPTGLQVGEHIELAPKRVKLVPPVRKASAFGKLKDVVSELRLEDEGFVRRVTERLKSEGLDKMV